VCSSDPDAYENVRPIKPPKKDKMKVDGMVAGIMALGRLIVSDKDNTDSVYNERGLVTI
jgi:phage terminase large subunit-like protein